VRESSLCEEYTATPKERVITVTDEEAYAASKRLAREEGLFMGISAGAAAFGALSAARELGKGKTVNVILPDTGERHFSREQHFNEY
jgi:cysteine synthase A